MYKIAICDDCDTDIKIIRGIIEHHKACPKDIALYEYHSGKTLLQDLEQDHNLIFLDMQMGEIDGYHTARELRKVNEKAILVFCTGVVVPTTEVFKVQPFRYLMKNFSKKQWEEEIEDILKEMIRKKEVKYFIATSDGSATKLKIDDILYISVEKRGSCLWIKDEKEKISEAIKCNKRINDIYDELKEYGFEYAHNSYIVNLNAIKKICGEELVLEGNIALTISRSKRKIFHEQFSHFLSIKYRRSRE